MKTRQLFNLVFLLFGMLSFVACEETEENNTGPVGTKSLQVTPGKLTLNYDGKTTNPTFFVSEDGKTLTWWSRTWNRK